jgi:glycosyltransferase involved in cell wall biosynthesis
VRVLALVPNRVGHSPGQRSHIEIWQKPLAEAGIDVVIEPFETERLQSVLYQGGAAAQLAKVREMMLGGWNRYKLLDRLDEFDVVYIYREAALLGPAVIERMVARRKPVIYNFDDPIFVPYKSPSNGYLSYLKFFGKTKEIIKIADLVIVNSSHLEEYARQFNPNVRRITNSFDPEAYRYIPFPEKPDPVTVGWSGSSTTVKNLDLVSNPLRQLAKLTRYNFHVIGSADYSLEGVTTTAQAWRRETEAEDLRKMQIGLVPLPDVEWNKYKFIMKVPQYMAVGIVPVGSPSSSNPEVIRHGENGFLASTDDEWIGYLEKLILDDDLRNRMSRAAAEEAHARYSLTANMPAVIDAFRSVVR